MRTCGAVLCGVVVLLWLTPARAEEPGMYVGVEARSQRAVADVTKADETIGLFPAVSRLANVGDAELFNSISALRFGYVGEAGSSLVFDASVAIGSITPTVVYRRIDPLAPGYEEIYPDGFLDPDTIYFDIAAGVRGETDAISWTAGIRWEMPFDMEEVQLKTPAGRTETMTVDQGCFAIEATIGTTGDARVFAGVGINMYSAKVTVEDTQNILNPFDDETTEIEYEYDSPLAIFIGIESRTEGVNAFARIALIGEKFLSAYAGAAVKF